MNLYLISQTQNRDYDTYDSAVVAAESETAARHTHPGQGPYGADVDVWSKEKYAWATSPDKVKATYIGVAAPEIKPSVIVASFNAG